MTVELISVGTEILLGNIVNTNAAWLAGQCAALGLSCYYQSVVGDNQERLRETLKTALERSDAVILSGGLGPTTDDLTKETAAEAMGMPLVEDPRSLERIEEYFRARGLEMTENNKKQALVPAGAVVLDNDNGTAPGLILEKGEKRVILLPGPPNELIPMFEERVRPYLQRLEPGILYSRTVKICGMGESKVASIVQDLIDSQTNPTIAPYAKTGEVHLRVTARAQAEKEAKNLVKPMVKELEKRFGKDIYTTREDVALEQAVVDLLLNRQLTVCTIESCTGGMLAARLINVPGVSETFRAGFITYSNKAKRKVAGVKKKTLRKYGAVSPQTAGEMARGAAKTSHADVTVSVTGIAGPDGGSREKPVGLVYIGCHIGDRTTVQEYRFVGNRGKIRESAVSAALTLLRRCILEAESER
ncbi:MAG: competence/damage-inducible protein A [Clostridiales bacterium]|nr:MAG: competence/damage-inducible protein A [Clostridiales bacterium]HJA30120.1 competence/damage-inducible protein A [Candidatus Eisenbergiella pullicola]